MKLYKIIISFITTLSVCTSQFSNVLVDIDYSNISENEMFIFEKVIKWV